MEKTILTFNDLPEVVAQLRDEVMSLRSLLTEQHSVNNAKAVDTTVIGQSALKQLVRVRIVTEDGTAEAREYSVDDVTPEPKKKREKQPEKSEKQKKDKEKEKNNDVQEGQEQQEEKAQAAE